MEHVVDRLAGDGQPWWLDDKRRARLNCISHLLSVIPYEDVDFKPMELPKRQKPKGYTAPDYQYRFIPERY